jgi:hypothetical protein
MYIPKERQFKISLIFAMRASLYCAVKYVAGCPQRKHARKYYYQIGEI